jgi:hypothetical protein
VQNGQLMDSRWVNPQLSVTAEQSTMALSPMVVTEEYRLDKTWVIPQLSATAGRSTMALTPMLVTKEQQSYGMSGQPNWPAGVSPMM